MNCIHCPQFTCKLKSDYNRHLQSTNHKYNEIIDTLRESLENLKSEYVWLQIHQRKFKKLTREYISLSSFPVHKYNTKELFVDIRDRFSPSQEVSWSNY